MNGREKCALYRKIKNIIAESNDIVFLSKECNYMKECDGTCEICDAENRYLEAELNRKVLSGESINIPGLLGMMGDFLEECATATGLRICGIVQMKYLSFSIDDVDFSVRAYNCLKRAGINTIGDIVDLDIDSLIHIRHLGTKTAREIINKLRYFGFEIENAEEKN